MLDCLSKNVGIFYNKNYTFDKRLINLVAKVHQINFIDFEESLSKINEVLNKTQENILITSLKILKIIIPTIF